MIYGCSLIFVNAPRYGASLSGSLCYAYNSTLTLSCLVLVYTKQVTMTRRDLQHTICHNTNTQQTPPPLWWSHQPLQWCGIDEPTPPEGWAALTHVGSEADLPLCFIKTGLACRRQWWPKLHPLSSSEAKKIQLLTIT
jgi:hypothetical protein